MSVKQLWPHQAKGLADLKAELMAGEKAVCLTSPTGGGKSLMIQDLILWGVSQGRPVALYTHRQLLRDQISEMLNKSGISHGLTASGFQNESWKRVQVCMMQTVVARLRGGGAIPDAKLVLVDECHDQARGQSEGVLKMHLEAGADVVGVTATPVDIGNLYPKLIVAGTNSELRDCGAHVICRCYEPTNPDIHLSLKPQATGEYRQGDVVKAIMSPVIFGHVLDHWKRLNPDGRPTILFAPGVKESIWFMEQFRKIGIRAAHICGETVIVDGVEHRSDRAARKQVLDAVGTGEIPVVCNRFVLREGFDLPQLYHGILATCFGSVTSYLQSVGRILRAHPSLDHVVLQDHGGNVHRHGSPNDDREWDLNKTANEIASERKQQMEESEERKPIVCPECSMIRSGGPQCPSCGFQHTHSVRKVIQLNGELKEIRDTGKKVVKKIVSDEEAWEKLYYVGKYKGWTFKKTSGVFKANRGHWPAWGMKMTPKTREGWSSVIGKLSWKEMNH